MTREEFLRKIGKIRIWRRGSETAPHKPLLLLWAFGRVHQGEPRLASYADEIEPSMNELLADFGPRRKLHPKHPFWRLRRDGLWEVPEAESIRTTTRGDALRSDLISTRAHGGLPEPIQRLLQLEPDLVDTAAACVLTQYLPEKDSEAIRARVRLSPASQPRLS